MAESITMDTQRYDELRDLYIKYMCEQIPNYHKPGQKRARVRHPSQYERIPYSETIDLTDQNVWVWSDLHLFHKNIIEFSRRPFSDLNHMHNALVDKFNHRVSPDDVSIWVGDIALCGDRDVLMKKQLDRYNGYKILIVGNHDFHRKQLKNLAFDEIHLLYYIELPTHTLVFTHFPMTNIPNDCINIHGHRHINQPYQSMQHINVNCEYHDYAPINLTNIITWSNTRHLSMNL